MLSSAMSLTRTASLSPFSSLCSRMVLSKVVLPLPRKPDSRVTGTGRFSLGRAGRENRLRI